MPTPKLAEQIADFVARDPEGVAALLVKRSDGRAAELVQHLERRLSSAPLDRLQRVWQLSASQAARVFGVSRQAYAKWGRERVPADRQVDVRLFDEATQVLLDHVKVDRIPAVVRRASAGLDGRSLLEIARTGELERVRNEVVAMFDLRRVQP